MSSKWIKVGDKMVVLAGNEKGQVANVLRCLENRVILEGLNIRTKHVKPQQQNQQGIVKMETPIHVSNVAHCNDEGKRIKLNVKEGKDGSKQLVYMDNGKEVVLRDLKKKKKK